MPAMNGWEFLENYRKLDSRNKGKVMIVMLTTSLFPEDKLRSKEIPEISAFENKPLTEEKLDNILKNFFAEEELLQSKIK
jgi:CheY-like chemotaxis protein